jgi:signal transduction histidine kinase
VPSPGRPQRADLIDVGVGMLFAVGVAAVTAKLQKEHGEQSADLLAYGCIAAAGFSIGIRRRFPVAALAVATAACSVYAARSYVGGPIYLAAPVCIYTVATLKPRREAATIVGVAVVTLVGPSLILRPGTETFLWALLYPSWACAAVLLGQSQRLKRERLDALVERARVLEETHEEEALRRVAEERLRLARDIHDVVAHSLASINVQAGVGAHLLDRDPEQARASLLAIRDLSSESLNELRATLGLLRAEDGEAVPHTPSPGLDDLARLVDGAARTGLDVALEVDGRQEALPPAIDVAAFRIVQESLTNVLRHAQAGQATVRVRHAPEQVEIEVADRGVGAAAPAEPGRSAGHGIAGMHERAEAVGGSVEAGPRPDGGFRVRARLPRRVPT